MIHFKALSIALLVVCACSDGTGPAMPNAIDASDGTRDVGNLSPQDSSVPPAWMQDASGNELPEIPDANIVDATATDAMDIAEPAGFELAALDSVRVRRLDSVAVPITLQRRGGFAGPVAVELLGLPANVMATPVTIGPAITTATINLSASSNAAHAGPVTIYARATAVDDPTLHAEIPFELYVAGAIGSLDESFSFDGSIELDPTTGIDSGGMRLTDTGDLIIFGSGQGTDPWIGYVLRLTSGGALDPAFGGSGIVTGFGSQSSVQAVLPWGDRLVVAAAESDGSLRHYLRMLSDSGEVEPFEPSGDLMLPEAVRGLVARTHDLIAYGDVTLVAATPPGSTPQPFTADLDTSAAWIASAATDASDRILVGHTTQPTFQIKRLQPDGSVDLSFGDLGTLSYPVPGGHDLARVGSILVNDDGSGIAMARSCYGGIYDCRIVLLGFTADGKPIPSVGPSGMKTVTDPGVGLTMFRQPDGRVLVAYADKINDNAIDVKLIRLHPDGGVDSTFNMDLPDDVGVLYEPRGHRLLLKESLSATGSFRVSRIWL